MSSPRATVDRPQTLMVVNTWGEDAIFYDLDSYAEVARIALPPQPHEARHDVKRDLVYVSFAYKDGYYFAYEEAADYLAIVDPRKRELVGTIDLAPEVGPHGLCLDAARDLLWVSVETGDGAVIALDLETHEVVKRIPVGGGKGKPHWMTMTADGRTIYTANREKPFISVLDLANGVLERQVELPQGAEDVELSEDESKLYVSSMYGKKLHVFDTISLEEIETKELGDFTSRVVLSSQGKLVVTHPHIPYQVEGRLEPGAVAIIDPDTLDVEATIDVGRCPIDLTISGDGRYAYVANGQSGTVFVVDLDRKEARRIIETGPRGTADSAPHGMLLL